jgi:hypothetical protein
MVGTFDWFNDVLPDALATKVTATMAAERRKSDEYRLCERILACAFGSRGK